MVRVFVVGYIKIEINKFNKRLQKLSERLVMTILAFN